MKPGERPDDAEQAGDVDKKHRDRVQDRKARIPAQCVIQPIEERDYPFADKGDGERQGDCEIEPGKGPCQLSPQGRFLHFFHVLIAAANATIGQPPAARMTAVSDIRSAAGYEVSRERVAECRGNSSGSVV